MTQPAEDPASEVSQRASMAIAAVLYAAGQAAEVLIQARAARLRRDADKNRVAAQDARQRLTQERAAASQVWRSVERDQWWRTATTQDIARVWQSVSEWRGVDPRAAEAQSQMAHRLADRGVHVEVPGGQGGDTAWLRAAVELADEEGPTGRSIGGTGAGNRDERATSVYGRLSEEDRERLAEHVRQGWPDRADELTKCRAWPALAGRLHERGQAGHDITETVRLLAGNDISNAHTPAALTCYLFDRMELREAKRNEQRSPAPAAARPAVIAGKVVQRQDGERTGATTETTGQTGGQAPGQPPSGGAVLTGTVLGGATEAEVQAAVRVACGYPTPAEVAAAGPVSTTATPVSPTSTRQRAAGRSGTEQTR